MDRPIEAIVECMRAEGLHPRVIDTFVEQYKSYRAGDTGKIPWAEVEQPRAGDIVPFAKLDEPGLRQHGEGLLQQLVVIQLNGGLGTTMKLERAKSLIEVREGLSFLDITAKQVLELRRQHGVAIPFLAMNSFRTRDDTLAVLGKHEALPLPGLPLDFLQNKVPRIEKASGMPVQLGDPEAEWAPPGHGDIYVALWATGLLEALIAKGYRWAFVSNIDNLGATVEPLIPAWLERHGFDFAMEVTDKTLADIKGGTLIRHKGRLALLETAQVEDAHIKDFQDISTFRVFNTNNLWWRLEALLAALQAGVLNLQLIVNPKNVKGVDVIQLETAMGAGIGCFDKAVGINVPRSRFAPVKSTSDLLVLRSDVYVLTPGFGVEPNPARDPALGVPVVQLDDRFYKGVPDFEQRFPHPLSLLGCKRLSVKGDVRFGRNVRLEGEVQIEVAEGHTATVADGSVLRSGVHSF